MEQLSVPRERERVVRLPQPLRAPAEQCQGAADPGKERSSRRSATVRPSWSVREANHGASWSLRPPWTALNSKEL